MKATVRPLDDPSLLEGVNRLRVRTFPQFPEARDHAFYSYIYGWFKEHPLGDLMERWVSVNGDGEVVGHLVATAQYYRINGQRVIAHTPGDYMVEEGYGFQAISLMRRFFRATENCVACDMVPTVIEVESRLGAEVAGELQYAAKLLNVSRLPVPAIPARFGRLLGLKQENIHVRGYDPGPPQEASSQGAAPQGQEDVEPLPFRPRLPLPAPVKGVLNGALSLVDKGLGAVFGGAGLKVEKIDSFDESFDEFFEKVAAGVACVPEKDSAFLRWRYGPGAPQHPVTVLGVRGGETLLGYTVLKIISAGSDDGYIFDLTTLPDRPDVARALIAASVRFFREQGAQIMRYRFVESPTSARYHDLRSLGFFYRKGRNNSLLVKFADGGLHKLADEISNWSYSVGDGEAAFWGR